MHLPGRELGKSRIRWFAGAFRLEGMLRGRHASFAGCLWRFLEICGIARIVWMLVQRRQHPKAVFGGGCVRVRVSIRIGDADVGTEYVPQSGRVCHPCYKPGKCVAAEWALPSQCGVDVARTPRILCQISVERTQPDRFRAVSPFFRHLSLATTRGPAKLSPDAAGTAAAFINY